MMRQITAVLAADSVMAGMTMAAHESKPVIGSTLNQTANTSISSRPSENAGVEIARIESTSARLSIHEKRFTADTMPASPPTMAAISSATLPSSSVLP
jgi:hypothetical protein